jgi:mannose-1-phosphate guanylyltransferase
MYFNLEKKVTLKCEQDSCWCIVGADDQNSVFAPDAHCDPPRAPVQYSRFGGTTSLLENAMRRAAKIAPDSQVVLTALEEYRELWEPITWSIPPKNKFVGDNRAGSLLTTSAALLSIAAQSPTNVVLLLPARCHVECESTLHAALIRAVAFLPLVEEGAITLGMIDLYEGVDEDYLMTSRSKRGPGFAIHRFAQRPIPWVTRHLRDQGAMVAYSGEVDRLVRRK